VEYSDPLNNSVSFPAYARVYEYNATGTYGVCESCLFNVVTSIRVIASPSNVTFVSNADSNDMIEDVTYTVIVPSNVTRGIYGIFLLQFCSLFPMVAVPNNSSMPTLGRSDFSLWYPHSGSCPAQVLSAKVLGVSGFRVVTLP
jgi:hypothetical protein